MKTNEILHLISLSVRQNVNFIKIYYCRFGSDLKSASLKINRLREPCEALPIFTQLKMRKTTERLSKYNKSLPNPQ